MQEALIAQRYRPLRVLGEGAMGRVDLVEDTVTGKQVALKVIGGPGVDLGADKTVLQFKQEFRLMTQLRHPNCCEVYDYGVAEDGAPYFTMEVVPGQGLDEMLPLAPERFREVFAQLLLALGYVHSLGLVHLDLKPANVRVGRVGGKDVVKLMDYGLMEVAGQGGLPIRGTLPYIAPEVIRRAPLDGRADLYSAGCLAFELLTGRPPFVKPTPGEVLRAHVGEAAPPLAAVRAGVPLELDRVVRRMLGKEPHERYATAYDVLAALGVEPPAGIGGSLLSPPLAGRALEVAHLGRALHDVRGGRPAEVWVWGPARIGKSRLLDELRCQAQLENLPVVRVASHEVGGAPYASLVALLRALMPGFRTAVPEELARRAPVLVPLLPELGVPPAPAMESPREEMFRLQAEATALLRAFAARQPFVLQVEDWRGTDDLTREFLAYFRRNAPDAPVLLVASTRRGPAQPGGPDAMGELPIAALDAGALATMLAGMLGEDVGAAFVARLAEVTGGVPGDVEQALEHLVKAGRLVRTAGRWNTDAPIADADLPSLASRAVRAFEAMDPAERAVVLALATLGRPIGLELLQAVTGVADEPLLAAIEALRRQRLVVRDDLGAFGIARRDDAVALLALVQAAEASTFHARAVDALARDLGGRAIHEAPLELVTTLAHHAVEADAGARALPWVIEAGRRTLALFALADAERYLAAATRIMEGTPGLEPATRVEVLGLLADVKRHRGQAADAEPLYAEAAELAAARGDVVAAGRLLISRAQTFSVRARYAEAVEAVDRALAACDPGRDAGVAGRGLRVRGRARFFMGDTAAALADTERALGLGREAGDRVLAGLSAAALGYFLTAAAPDRVAEGLAHLEEAVGLLRELGDRPGLLSAQNLLGNALNARGDLAGAGRAFQGCVALAAECGIPREEAVARVNLALIALDAGDPGEALDQATRAREQAAPLGAKLSHAMALAAEGQALALRGRPADAAAATGGALAMARDMGNKYLQALILPRHAEVLAAGGRAAEAAAALAELRGLIEETGNRESLGRLETLEAELRRREGDRAGARTRLAAAQAEATATGARGVALAALVGRARLAADEGAWDQARRFADEGLALAAELGARGQAAELHGLRGLAMLRAGADGAAEAFQVMAGWAEAEDVPLALARALFGWAAAAPFAEQAAARAARAAALVEAVAATLDGPAREAFRLDPELARVLAGDFKGHGQAAASAVRTPSGPLGAPMGGMGGMGGFGM